MKRQEKPVVLNKGSDNEVHHHPAFGVITVAQWHGGGSEWGARMFGSDLKHRTGMTIEVRTAIRKRALGGDWVHDRDLLVKFDMTLSQWARFVSSVGNGSGTPVTLGMYRSPDAEMIDAPSIAEPELSKRELHGEEMAQTLREALQEMADLTDRLGTMIDGTVSKKELRDIHKSMKITVDNLPLNVQFAHDQFARATEKLVDQTKTEIEGFIDGLAKQIGYDTIRSAAPSLPSPVDGST